MTLDLTSLGWTSPPTAFSYDPKDCILYALGIGAMPHELDYVYEGRGPRVFPTFGVLAAQGPVLACIERSGATLASIVHGAQTVRVHDNLPPQATLHTTATLHAIYDLKRFAQLEIRAQSHLPEGRLLIESTWSIIVRGEGRFGGSLPPKGLRDMSTQGRPSSFTITQSTLAQQALIYRLSGDRNPLHVDPEVAVAAGFDRGPILHGLATFGFAARAIQEALGATVRIQTLEAQFRRPVWPGESLTTQGWLRDAGMVIEMTNGNGEVVIGNAWAEVTPISEQSVQRSQRTIDLPLNP